MTPAPLPSPRPIPTGTRRTPGEWTPPGRRWTPVRRRQQALRALARIADQLNRGRSAA